jgi:hypothetical protein
MATDDERDGLEENPGEEAGDVEAHGGKGWKNPADEPDVEAHGGKGWKNPADEPDVEAHGGKGW